MDVAVVGAGSFGAWTAWHLRQAGLSVRLLDAHGPGNARASSGGESRVIRSSLRSLDEWKALAADTGESLFHEAGVLWLAGPGDGYAMATLGTLERLGVRHEQLSPDALAARYPQFAFAPGTFGILEPKSGALMARRAVQAVVRRAVQGGVAYATAAVAPPAGSPVVATASGERVSAGTFVFACGPWLPKLFPELLRDRIVPTRQEVFFFGPPAGDPAFAPPCMPAWIDFGDEVYGLPDLEGRGFKVAPDRHGPPFDPDGGERVVSAESIEGIRGFLARRFPALATAPLLETRVCQYENTSNGDFLIDRHPELSDVWLVGGGSGHGFKHGPAVGRHVADRIARGAPSEPRFALTTKTAERRRQVY